MQCTPGIRASLVSVLDWRVGIAAGFVALAGVVTVADVECSSSSGGLVARFGVGEGGRLEWSLRARAGDVMRPGRVGVRVDGVDLGEGVELGLAQASEMHETFVVRGGKSTGTNSCRVFRIPVAHRGGTKWTLEVRMFEDGMGWRCVVPGAGVRRVEGEATTWVVPDGVQAWYQLDTRNYEGVYERSAVEGIPRVVKEDGKERSALIGPPLTLDMPGIGYVLITEANLRRYSGMALRPTGTARLELVLEDDPKGFEVKGDIVTPWRVTLVAPDLNRLVNSDVVLALADPPDPRLFPEGGREAWIRPGRALITWCVFGNDGAQWHLQKWFVDQCAAMHCEFLLLDGGWRSERWGLLKGGADPWVRLKELCDYGRGKGVGIVVWHSFPEGRDDGPGLTRAAARDEFFSRCREAGVQGVKIDFFDAEGFEVVEAWEDLTRRAAENRMTINFHGSNKPTGESRTWPNQITREGIREQEYLLWGELPRAHYAALPFTRFVAGHGDFLPGYVRAKYLRNTSAVFQMATAVVATSPFLCWPDHPEDYRASVFLGLVQAMPVVWDETRVLGGSEIGRRVALARRAGRDWFIGALNCEDQARQWVLPLDFLGAEVSGTLYWDKPAGGGVMVEAGREMKPGGTVELELPAGGGFVGWLKPLVKP